MTRVKPPPARDASEELAALIETLHATGRRLEELTAGEVDGVADREGRTFLLRHVQEQLREREAARQAAILNALPAHIALLDAGGTIISVNQGWRTFARENVLQGPQYAIGVGYLEICDSARGDDAAEAQQAAAGIRSVLAGAVPDFSFEYPCHSPTQQRWYLMKVTPLADEPPHGVVVMHLDITERKQAEKAVEASKNLLQLVLENVPSHIFWKDRDLRFLGCNAQFAKDAGYSRPDELTGKTDFEMVWRDQAELYRADDRSVLESGTARLNIIEPQTTPDGNTIWLRTSKLPLRGKDDRIIGVLGAYEDITERKLAELELRESEEEFRTLAEAMPQIVWITGADGRNIYFNQHWMDYTGLTLEESLGHGWNKPFHPDDRQQAWDAWQKATATTGIYSIESRLRRADGMYRWWLVRGVPLLGADGKILKWFGTCTDIHDLKMAGLEIARANGELRESESRFRGLTALSTDWYWQQDETLRFVDFSGGDHVKGWGTDQMTWVGKQRWEIPGIMPLSGDWKEHKALLQARQPFRDFEYQRRDGDGALRYVAASGEPIFDAGGGFAGYRGVATDITERKAAEYRIRRLNRVYAVLSGINALIVRVRDRDELFREACRIAVETGGFRMIMLCIVDRSTMKIVPVASAGKDEFLFSAVKEILASPEVASKSMVGRAIAENAAIVSNDLRNDDQLLLGNYYRDAEVRSLAVLPLVVADVAAGALVLYSEEIDFFDEEEIKLLTELAGDIGFAIDHIEKRERIDYLAYYDELTGLANRRLFLERVAQYMRIAVSGGHKLAVFLIDLARFKNINDSLGRAAGDELLRQVAEWLTRKAAGDANQVARVGADQFAVVMPEVTQDCDVARHLETTMEALADHPFHLNDSVFRIAARVGIAMFPDDGGDAESLFRNAEAALKLVKACGERYMFYTQKMTDAVASKLTLENQLRQALDNQEFVLHYQPKVSLTSGKVVSAEALIRWNDPRTGLVPPGRFIPILEETGLIYEVGRWALRQAIADYLRWRAAGLPAARIAVNVSPLQLRNRDFIDEIGRVIGIDPLAAAGLELEITESLIMEDVKHNIASLQAIRDMGVSIAIDDFGTGFSSLSYLAKLPVDTLKIDRSFVIDMTAGPQGLALVSTIIKLAHSLKLKVVAEGVETEEQRRLLHLLGCDEMQGFLFSKPLPGEIFEARFLASEARA